MCPNILVTMKSIPWNCMNKLPPSTNPTAKNVTTQHLKPRAEISPLGQNCLPDVPRNIF